MMLQLFSLREASFASSSLMLLLLLPLARALCGLRRLIRIRLHSLLFGRPLHRLLRAFAMTTCSGVEVTFID
jgi:hypothetical protein